MRELLRKRLILFILILLLFISPLIFPYLYTPPALTSKKVSTYLDCVNIMLKYDQYKNLRFHNKGINWKDDGFMLEGSHFLNGDKERLNTFFSKEDVYQIEKICNQLEKIGCFVAVCEGDVILFIPKRSLFFTCPGVLYSLNELKPNDSTNNDISKYKPFINIYGPWYMSRSLILSLRSNSPHCAASLPKSLIDRSLEVKGIDFEIGYNRDGRGF